MPPDQEIEIKGYFGKYIEDHFKHIDDSVLSIKESIKEMKIDNEKTKAEVKIENEKTKTEIKTEVDEIKRDNKATRWWIIGTGIAVIFGIAAIFFSFAQIQASWMQQVIAIALKAIK